MLYGEHRYGIRKLWGLIEWLPPTSALARALNDNREPWNQTHELLRVLVRLQDESNALYWASHFKGKFRDPVTFDGETPAKVKQPMVRASDLGAMMGK